MVWGDRVRPIARAGHAVEPLLIDDYAVEPAEDPVIGPELAAARTRLGLTVDQLAERTRIRPARHRVDRGRRLRAVRRRLLRPRPPAHARPGARHRRRRRCWRRYDERYADAPINPRRVFEAELATGAHGSIRGTRGGPNWSVLVAAVMALVLAWSVARLVMDGPVELRAAAGPERLGGRRQPAAQPVGDPVPVCSPPPAGAPTSWSATAPETVVFSGNLAFGETRTLQASPRRSGCRPRDGSLDGSRRRQGPRQPRRRRASGRQDIFPVTDLTVGTVGAGVTRGLQCPAVGEARSRRVAGVERHTRA